jgi:hypothetical protein
MKTATPLDVKKLPAAPAKKTVSSKSKTIAKIAAPTPIEVKAKPSVKHIAKPKLVRDSFTIPKDEYLVLSELKARMTTLMQPAKKSELLRAGLKVLAAMSDAAIKKALLAVPSIKTGRPAHSKK